MGWLHQRRHIYPSGRGSKSRALHVANESFCIPVSAFDPSKPRDLLLQTIIPVGRLACVCVARPAFTRLGLGDVDIVRGRELDGVLAV